MGKIFGVSFEELGLKCENGEPLDPSAFKPVVDMVGGRVFGVKPDGSVILVKQYGKFQTRSAKDLAQWLWSDKADWEPLAETVVSCLGGICCSDEKPKQIASSAWRITAIDGGVVQARATATSVDGTVLEVGSEHVMYVSPYPERSYSNEVDTFIACIERFGRPYDVKTGVVTSSYSNIYRTDSDK